MNLFKKSSIKLTLVASLALLGSGCASTLESLNPLADLEPWVKPYERSNLADPIMSMNRNPVALAYAKHVFESREGARGADGGAGGGCGCN
ncbi:DUF4266 domain-containing protein [Glaciecola sp. MH2013]|uniref:DUF4266 domain-containing protein n=1 Tax=Glaciecola sp. MH2013 TaxID=2785524 RepID=UPI00189F1FAA|nr:DUF4266 domain-containing protein [Glaciecola sp. MH2013]MBF7074551.1 DUF4266 domain-containing protein [Glaciecola sp. MH2013]